MWGWAVAWLGWRFRLPGRAGHCIFFGACSTRGVLIAGEQIA
jgi:hypothetical protein